jgi:hypothetical protein
VYTYNSSITFINDGAKNWGVRTSQSKGGGVRRIFINRASYPSFDDGKYQSGLIQLFQAQMCRKLIQEREKQTATTVS